MGKETPEIFVMLNDILYWRLLLKSRTFFWSVKDGPSPPNTDWQGYSQREESQRGENNRQATGVMMALAS
jgi:hypothetical protein